MSDLNVKPSTIFCRDNLDILSGINNNCVDLIYLDPPFNKKKVFTAPIGSSAEGAEFSDIFREKDIKDEWVDSIRFESSELYEYLKGVKAFSNKYNYCYLVYMAIRLLQCQRILKDTGSIYLHCDSTMSHYLKIVLDCIFGEKNFRNEVIWHYPDKLPSGVKKLPQNHDIVLTYGKSINRAKYNIVKIPRETPLKQARKVWNKELNKWQGYERDENGRVVYEIKTEKMADDVWSIAAAAAVRGKEKTGYPTQKPLALLERIIKASSDEGDVVLDPFCGCATSCIAAEKLNRKWVGIDVSQKAYELVKMRLEKEVPTDMWRDEPSFSTDIPKRDTTEEDRDMGYVYVIANSNWNGMFKVGITKDVKRRLNSYQTSDPYRAYELKYSLKTPHFREIEKHIHKTHSGDYEWVEGDLEGIKSSIQESEKRIKKTNKGVSVN